MELNGTFNMMGNVTEWMEGYYNATSYNPTQLRAFRGGSFALEASRLVSTYRNMNYPQNEDSDFGFRVASMPLVPEPSGLVMLLAPLVGTLLRRRRKCSACAAR